MRQGLFIIGLVALSVLVAGCSQDLPPPSEEQPSADVCAADVKECPDGSFVSRDPDNDCEFRPCPSDEDSGNASDGDGTSDLERHDCTPDERDVDACIELYKPVCGYSDGSAETYSNDCFACMDENVEYWTEGACEE
ncbi:MAG: hypothetical protein ACLFO2_01780 [Candidatus Woesearchaeota archaeon]